MYSSRQIMPTGRVTQQSFNTVLTHNQDLIELDSLSEKISPTSKQRHKDRSDINIKVKVFKKAFKNIDLDEKS